MPMSGNEILKVALMIRAGHVKHPIVVRLDSLEHAEREICPCHVPRDFRRCWFNLAAMRRDYANLRMLGSASIAVINARAFRLLQVTNAQICIGHTGRLPEAPMTQPGGRVG